MIVRPLRGRLVAPGWAQRVVAPMSDGMVATDRARLLASDDSFLQVTRPVPLDVVGEDAERAFARNRAALRRLLDAGAYQTDPGPRLLVYRMHIADRSHTGLVVDVEAAAFADHRVRGHESVQPDRVTALARQFDAVPVQAEMVALVHEYDDYVDGLIEATQAATPALGFVDVSGVGQEVWEISDAAIVRAACTRLSELQLYIADGHHRVAAALRPHRDPAAPRESVLAVVYPAPQLHLLAFHRVLRGPVEVDGLLEVARRAGTVERGLAPARGTIGISVGGEHFRWTPHPIDGTGMSALDVTRLHRDLLEPLVGWDLGGRLTPVTELVPIAELEATAAESGGAVFLLAPPTIRELISVADRGEVMLPKSTFFDPKPRGGLVLVGDY